MIGVLALALVAAGDAGSGHASEEVAADARAPRTLKAAAGPHFAVGVGVSVRIVDRPDDQALLTSQFGWVTPENCMKVQSVQPVEGEFRFADSDRFVEFAAAHRLNVVGHCLVWAKDDRTPAWFFRDGDGDRDGDGAADADLLLARMKTHIDTVVGRYRGRIKAWDVVNEALADGDAEYLRDSGWTRLTGEEFLVKAFEYAHAADPDALLIYNDYRCDTPGKREKLLRLARMFRERRVPVHAIGLQGHYELDAVPYEGLEAMLRELRELEFKVVVSELDIDVVTRGRWWAENGKYREELAKFDPYRDGCPPEVLQRQAEQYQRLFELFRRYGDVVERVSFWNLHDGESWLNHFPWHRVNHPLLFDRDRKAKPAFHAVLKALE
jgi:endo-1,4-beta-xylanase